MNIEPRTEYLEKGGKYPTNCVIVDKVEDGKVSFCPSGGGFVHKTSVTDFKNYFEEIPEDQDEEIIRKKFCLESPMSYYGYTYGRLWNGWEEPMFERHVVDEMIDHWQKTEEPDYVPLAKTEDGFYYETEWYQWIDGYDPEDPDKFKGKPPLKGTKEYEQWIIKPFTIEFHGKEIEVCSIGDGWCWSEGE